MESRSERDIRKIVEELPIISSHEHHLPDEWQRTMTLDRILDFAYIGWYAGRKTKLPTDTPQKRALLSNANRDKKYFLPDAGDNTNHEEAEKQRRNFLDLFGYNSYWVWLEKGIQKIYELDSSITSQNWDSVSDLIATMHRDPNAHIRIMKEVGGYLRAVQDTYWDYGSDLGYPEIFSPTMRIDMFVTSSHPTLPDHDQNCPFESYPDAPTENFDDYLGFVRDLFISWRNKGGVAMKCASAYERPISFNTASYADAQKVFFRSKDHISSQERIVYGDFMFNWFCQLNMELGIPFQIHTGLADIAGSNPMLFEPIIKRYPDIRFVLFHAGFPWYNEIAGLAHNYNNIFIDMVWAPIISTSAAIQALHQYIEVSQTSNLIGWGSDTWTSEEAVGAVLAWKFIVSKVLSEMVNSDYIDLKKAEALAEKLMYKNNAELYGLEKYC